MKVAKPPRTMSQLLDARYPVGKGYNPVHDANSSKFARGGKAVSPMRPLKSAGKPVVTHPKPSRAQLAKEAMD